MRIKRLNSFPNSFICNLTTFAIALFFTGALVLAGCDSNGATEPENQVERIEIFPDSASIQAGESVDFDVAALTASGDTVRDADLKLTWWSTDSGVFTVEDDGTATGQESGTALCKVEATDQAASKAANLRFTGRDSAFVFVF